MGFLHFFKYFFTIFFSFFSNCNQVKSKFQFFPIEFHQFWRLRADSGFEPTWMVKEIEMYPSPTPPLDNLIDNSSRAFASSSYEGM